MWLLHVKLGSSFIQYTWDVLSVRQLIPPSGQDTSWSVTWRLQAPKVSEKHYVYYVIMCFIDCQNWLGIKKTKPTKNLPHLNVGSLSSPPTWRVCIIFLLLHRHLAGLQYQICIARCKILCVCRCACLYLSITFKFVTEMQRLLKQVKEILRFYNAACHVCGPLFVM